MDEAYSVARTAIADTLQDGGNCLDCGASGGHEYEKLQQSIGLSTDRYTGIEWNAQGVEAGRSEGRNIVQGDLNNKIAFPDGQFKCVFGLSVLEHLLNPCNFLRESYRCLEPGGTLVILTPNISTFFFYRVTSRGENAFKRPAPRLRRIAEARRDFQGK